MTLMLHLPRQAQPAVMTAPVVFDETAYAVAMHQFDTLTALADAYRTGHLPGSSFEYLTGISTEGIGETIRKVVGKIIDFIMGIIRWIINYITTFLRKIDIHRLNLKEKKQLLAKIVSQDANTELQTKLLEITRSIWDDARLRLKLVPIGITVDEASEPGDWSSTTIRMVNPHREAIFPLPRRVDNMKGDFDDLYACVAHNNAKGLVERCDMIDRTFSNAEVEKRFAYDINNRHFDIENPKGTPLLVDVDLADDGDSSYANIAAQTAQDVKVTAVAHLKAFEAIKKTYDSQDYAKHTSLDADLMNRVETLMGEMAKIMADNTSAIKTYSAALCGCADIQASCAIKFGEEWNRLLKDRKVLHGRQVKMN